MKELLFGTAYYPEYMPYDRLETDIAMMKAAGMNVIRIAESTWSTLEPQDGTFDFSFIDRVLEAAEREGLSVIVGTPTYAVPAWLARKEPEVMALGAGGRNLYGRRQLMDIVNPAFRYHAERVIRRLAEHTARHPRVIGFQIDNETKHYGMASENVQELFVAYLKEKFRTTENLNRAFGLAYWSNSIHDWKDFPDMRGCVNAGLACEFGKFQRTLAAQYLVWQRDLVSEYKREDQFITHNFDFEWKKFGADIAQDGYSYGVQPDISHYEAAEAVTVAGTDIYHPTQDALTGAEIAFGGDSVRSLKQDNYFVLECQAQAFKYWTPYPGQLRLHAYSHLASGADAVLYWNWHSIHNGYETYWKGLLSHDLETNPTYEEACQIGREWKEKGTLLRQLKKKNRAALLMDTQSLHALRWFPIDKELSYNDVVRHMYDALYEMNIECDVVDVHGLEEERYDLLIAPALYSVSEDLIGRLAAFVKRGGVLVSSFRSFVADEHLSVYADAAPHGLTDCFGMSYNRFTEPGTTKLAGEPARYFCELLRPDTAETLAAYEHKYWGAYSGATRNRYGQGCAYYIGTYTSPEFLKTVYADAAEKAGIPLPDVRWPLIVRSGETPAAGVLHYIFNYSADERSMSCPYEETKELLTGKRYRRGDTIAFKDWDVVILQEVKNED
ncbi:MAG: beta-galactosidase [Lachnospiraceae bacterium]|nr:beta-galactosidase [Lachnospiraceae bacterium]